MIIALSAGHGYMTAGKRTCPFPDGRQMREHEFNRDVALALDYLLRKDGHKTVLCFDDIGVDDMPLADRVGKANQSKADIYVSVHANAFGDGANWHSANGLVGMYYKGSVNGERLAKCIIEQMSKDLQMPVNSYQPGTLYEPKYTAMPCVIVECGFMTNENDAKKLITYEYRQACAEAIYKGILKYFGIESEKDTKSEFPIIIEVPKKTLNTAKVNESVESLAKKHPNFINGMFFSWQDNSLYDLCISNEQYLENKAAYDNTTKPKGTFYLYKDGRCGVVMLRSIATKDLQMLIQGIDLADLSKDALEAQGWGLISVTERCKRAAIGYDSVADKIKVVVVNGSLADLRAECIKAGLVYNDKAYAIALDAGGSFALTLDGKIVYNSDGRYMRNIIYW